VVHTQNPVRLCSAYAVIKQTLCVSEKSSVFVKDPTDLMTNVYGDTVVTTNVINYYCRLIIYWLSTYHTSHACVCVCVCSGQPECVYTVFKRLGTELALGLFLNVRAEEQPELYQEIVQLSTRHWHGLISAPVSLKSPLWSSGFSTALDARDKLMDVIKDKLRNDTQGFVGSLSTLPLPDSSCASQHLLLFISALIPKALASLLTSFTLALAGNEQVRRRAVEDPAYLRGVLLEVQRLWPPFIGGRRIVDQDSTLAGFHVPKGHGAIYISHAVHRDPDVFQQPDDFLPERWSKSGPRNCIGVELTDIFLKDACTYLLKHYDWCLDPPSQDLEYKWLPVSRPANPPTICFTRPDRSGSDSSDGR
uniref:Cytochrome P450 n=1 Tax=Mola mola TaxID=94237 RepID=A0A3Q3XR79_MOLML